MKEAHSRAADQEAFFARTFGDAEGHAEGESIGSLVRQILTETPAEEHQVFTTENSGQIDAAVIFTRMHYGDRRAVWLLAPMAVATDKQGQGIGQSLLQTALSTLRERGVDIVLTYGDPRFYGKVGFHPIRESDIPAPFALSMPEGWLGQSLTSEPVGQIEGPAQCIQAFNNPVYW